MPTQPKGQWPGVSPPPAAPTGPPAAPNPWAAPAARRGWSSWPRGVQIAAVASVVAAFFGAIIVIASTNRGGSGSSSDEATAPAAQSAAPSSSEDWLRAVCRPGTFSQGTQSSFGGSGLGNAAGSANCMSQKSGVILIGQYTSSFALENDVARWRGGSYATVEAANGETWLFLAPLPGKASASALSPLTQFGFQIQTVTGGYP